MLILLTFLVLAAAVSAYFLYFKRNRSERELGAASPSFLPETTNLRPLFEPTAEELRSEELETERRLKEIEAERKTDAKREKALDFQNDLNAWREKPDRKSFADLLDRASVDGELFADAAEAIAEAFQNGEIENLSATDLIQLLESHFWLFPADQRSPGISYRFQTVLSSLRSSSVTQ